MSESESESNEYDIISVKTEQFPSNSCSNIAQTTWHPRSYLRLCNLVKYFDGNIRGVRLAQSLAIVEACFSTPRGELTIYILINNRYAPQFRHLFFNPFRVSIPVSGPKCRVLTPISRSMSSVGAISQQMSYFVEHI